MAAATERGATAVGNGGEGRSKGARRWRRQRRVGATAAAFDSGRMKRRRKWRRSATAEAETLSGARGALISASPDHMDAGGWWREAKAEAVAVGDAGRRGGDGCSPRRRRRGGGGAAEVDATAKTRGGGRGRGGRAMGRRRRRRRERVRVRERRKEGGGSGG